MGICLHSQRYRKEVGRIMNFKLENQPTDMKKYVRKPAEVMAHELDHDGILIADAGEFTYYKGDWIITANDKYWICEGDVFNDLYKEVNGKLEMKNE